MKHYIPKCITVIFLIIGLFPALSTAGPWDPVEQQPDPYKALQEQLNGYKRQDEQKRRKQDQQQKAYKDWILGGPPPKSQTKSKKASPPSSRYRPPQNNNSANRRTQPSARSSSGKKPGFCNGCAGGFQSPGKPTGSGPSNIDDFAKDLPPIHVVDEPKKKPAQPYKPNCGCKYPMIVDLIGFCVVSPSYLRKNPGYRPPPNSPIETCRDKAGNWTNNR